MPVARRDPSMSTAGIFATTSKAWGVQADRVDKKTYLQLVLPSNFLIVAHSVLLYASLAFVRPTDSYPNARVTAVQVSRTGGHVKNLDQNSPIAQRMLAHKVH